MQKLSKREVFSLLVISSAIIIATVTFAFIAFQMSKNQIPNSIHEIWGDKWDAPHYTNIAKNWYYKPDDPEFKEGMNNVMIAFFPVYPLLIRAAAFMIKDYDLAAIIISNIAYVFGAFYLYKLVRLDFSRKNALRSMIYFSVFPTAIFLHMGYTESLFLALSIASFYYARTSKWVLAGILGMIASATRLTGGLLFPALIVEYLAQKNFKLKNVRKEILWLILIPLGFVGYLFINFQVFNNPFHFLEVLRSHWGVKTETPLSFFKGFYDLIKNGFDSGTNPYYRTVGIWVYFFGFLSLVLTIYTSVRLRLSYGVYSILTWWVITSSGFYISLPRYILAIFPMFIGFSIYSERDEIQFITIFVSIFIYSLFLTQFGIGGWIG